MHGNQERASPRTDKGGPEHKTAALRDLLREMKSVVVAYSGGVDSAFLVAVAVEVLGKNVLAVTARSASYPEEEYEAAKQLAASLGARHRVVHTREVEDPAFAANPPNRCYLCKQELFGTLLGVAKEEGIPTVIDGSNADDRSDYRPGMQAARDLGVRSPLVEVGLGKEDIRVLSRRMGLPTWNKPAMACLASRFPYGETITEEALSRVERAERVLRGLGFVQVRVRSYGLLARIEVESERVPELVADPNRQQISRALKELGFVHVTVDLDGYRTGSMNEGLPEAAQDEGD